MKDHLGDALLQRFWLAVLAALLFLLGGCAASREKAAQPRSVGLDWGTVRNGGFTHP